ncbi:MAG TPA: hypothetical protein PL182_04090 [Pseudobdellovibrionaceae bacterium]|nr:hypothetical protein [Pseudobdellovibrionaceae bacterium]
MTRGLFALFATVLLLAPSVSRAKLEPREKTHRIKSLVLVESSGSVSLVVNPLRRTRLTIDVQNPRFVREQLKENSYVGVVNVEMDFYRTAQKQPTAIVKKISKAKDDRLPAYDGDFKE